MPKPKRKRYVKSKRKKFDSKGKQNNSTRSRRKKKKLLNKNRGKPDGDHNTSKRRIPRHGHVISEDFDIEDDSGNLRKKPRSDQNDDQRFNTEKHHKKQHKF